MRRLFGALLLLLLLPMTTRAQGPNQAGLVIQYGDGHIETTCVSFNEAEITGFDLLRRSGLPMSYDAQAGTLVCSIGDEGCFFPVDGCLCQCSGIGTCIYWSYHFLDTAGNWTYSQLGAAVTKVRPGEINGWRWGAGGANSAPPPVGVTFDSICAAPVALPPTVPPAATSTSAPTAPPIPTLPPATQVATSTPTLPAVPTTTSIVRPRAATATLSPVPSVTIDPTETLAPLPSSTAPPTLAPPAASPVASEEIGGRPMAPYLFFALLMLLLGGGVLWARRG